MAFRVAQQVNAGADHDGHARRAGLAFGEGAEYSPRMIWRTLFAAMLLAVPVRAQEAAVPDLTTFFNWTEGHYQVLAQGGRDTGMQVNRFMNEMLKQYSKYFSNWTPKAGARVIVFTNLDDFR